MKKLIYILPFLASCQWIVTHPAEDAVILEEAESILEKLYKYEIGKPLPPPQKNLINEKNQP